MLVFFPCIWKQAYSEYLTQRIRLWEHVCRSKSEGHAHYLSVCGTEKERFILGPGCCCPVFLLCTWGTAGWSVYPAGWWDEWPIFLSGCRREWGEPERVPGSWHALVVPSRHPRSCWTPVCSRCLCRFDKWRAEWLMLCGSRNGHRTALCFKLKRPPRLGGECSDIHQGQRYDRTGSLCNNGETLFTDKPTHTCSKSSF